MSLLGSLPIVAACRNTIRRGSRISSTPCRLPNFLKEIKLLPSFLLNEMYKQTHWQNTVFFFLRFELLLVGFLDVTLSFYSFGLVLAILDNDVSVRFYLPTILDTFSCVLMSGKNVHCS